MQVMAYNQKNLIRLQCVFEFQAKMLWANALMETLPYYSGPSSMCAANGRPYSLLLSRLICWNNICTLIVMTIFSRWLNSLTPFYHHLLPSCPYRMHHASNLVHALLPCLHWFPLFTSCTMWRAKRRSFKIRLWSKSRSLWEKFPL